MDSGARPPKRRWDLVFQTFLLSIPLFFGLFMGGLTLIFLESWKIRLNLDAGAPADVQFFLPEVSWLY